MQFCRGLNHPPAFSFWYSCISSSSTPRYSERRRSASVRIRIVASRASRAGFRFSRLSAGRVRGLSGDTALSEANTELSGRTSLKASSGSPSEGKVSQLGMGGGSEGMGGGASSSSSSSSLSSYRSSSLASSCSKLSCGVSSLGHFLWSPDFVTHLWYFFVHFGQIWIRVKSADLSS